MNVAQLEEYLRNKYGILSIIEEKRQEVLDELERMSARRRRRRKGGEEVGGRDARGGDNWKRDLDSFVLDSDLRQYFVGESVQYKDGRVVSESKELLVMIVRSYDCLRSRRSSQDVEEEDDQDEEWEDLVEDEEPVGASGNERDGKSRKGEARGGGGGGQCSKPKKRILYFVLTTGRAAVSSSKQGDGQKSESVIINAMEYGRLSGGSFGEESLMHPGTKLMLRLGQEGREALQVQNSMLLLRNDNVRILGGSVESLVEAWRLNNLLSGSGSRGFFSGSKNLMKKPPKFIPFVNKESEKRQLVEQVKTAQQNYQQSKEDRSNSKPAPSSAGEESKKDVSLLESSVKAYTEFIERIHQYKKQNLVSLDKFNLLNASSKSGGKDSASSKKVANASSAASKSKLKLHDDLDPGAPIRGRLLRSTERIDSDAREFLKSRNESSSKITLFDHLFSKLEIKNTLGTGIDDSTRKDEWQGGAYSGVGTSSHDNKYTRGRGGRRGAVARGGARGGRSKRKT